MDEMDQLDQMNLMVDDEQAANILAEAFETIERVEREQAERAPEREQRELNMLYEKRRQPRNSKTADDGELVYKTYEPEPPQVTMDPATVDARVRVAIQKSLEGFADLMGNETGQMEKRFNAELKRLTNEIEVLREDVRAANAKNITPLRPRDVA